MTIKRKHDQEIKKSSKVGEDPDKAKRRLSNIRSREVSLVDEGANGKDFLIVKNKAQPTATPAPTTAPNKDDNLFKAAITQPTTEVPPIAPVKPITPFEPDFPIVKGLFSKHAEETLQVVPFTKALAVPQKEMFLAMSEALMQFAMGMDMIRADLIAFVSSDGTTGFMGEQIIKSIRDNMKDATEKDIFAAIEKAGKKMKGCRLQKLKEIQSSLTDLLKELDEEETEVSKGGTMSDPTKTTEVAPTAPAAAPATSTPAATTTPAAAPATEAPVEKKFTEAEVQKMIDASVEKAVQPLKEEIKVLKEAPAESAAAAGGTTEEVTKGKGKEESIFKNILCK